MGKPYTRFLQYLSMELLQPMEMQMAVQLLLHARRALISDFSKERMESSWVFVKPQGSNLERLGKCIESEKLKPVIDPKSPYAF